MTIVSSNWKDEDTVMQICDNHTALSGYTTASEKIFLIFENFFAM